MEKRGQLPEKKSIQDREDQNGARSPERLLRESPLMHRRYQIIRPGEMLQGRKRRDPDAASPDSAADVL